MNYETYIYDTFTIDIDSLSLRDIILLNNGQEPLLISEYQGSFAFNEVCYYVANYSRRNNRQNLQGFMIQADNGLYLINSNRNDFLEFYFDETCLLSLGRAYPNENGDIRDGVSPNNYDNTNYRYGYNNYTYGSYSRSVDSDYHIFDYSNLRYDDSLTYYNDSMPIRGENMSVYNDYLIITNASSGVYKISYGRPFAQMRDDSYNQGYGNGFASGYVQGQDIGFQNGVNSQGTPQAQATAFTYIEGAFRAVSNIMTLEVLPNITLGLAFSIPLVFVLIMTIFKLVRK